MVVLVFAGAELCIRFCGFEYKPRCKLLWKPTVAGFQGTIEFYVNTVAAPPGYMWVSEPDTPITDQYGFRKPELPIDKDPWKVRVAFLGGSTTQGGYRPYPERAIRLLNNALDTDRYEGLNVACSSYSTHQSLIALERWVLPRNPNVVVIYHGWNDAGVQSDGYADHEKDFVASHSEHFSTNSFAAALLNLRISQAIGKVVHSLDKDWPRPRVPPEQYRRNLERMVTLCKQRGIRVILISRPESLRRPLPNVGDIEYRAFSKWADTTNPEELYAAKHRLYNEILEGVAREQKVTVCDASGYIDDLQEKQAAGVYPPGMEIFEKDACHLRDYATEKLACLVACAIAPEHSSQIVHYAEDSEHCAFLAKEFMEDTLPHEAIYCAKLAQDKDPSLGEGMRDLMQNALNECEFATLFEQGRWGGEDVPFGRKLQKLVKCLTLKPDDVGVRVQIARICAYMGHSRDWKLYANLIPPPVRPLTTINDADVTTLATAPDNLEDVVFYITHPEPMMAAAILLVMYAKDGDQKLCEVSVAATNDDPDLGTPRWHLIRSRPMLSIGDSDQEYSRRVTLPEVADGTVIPLIIDPTDRDLQRKYKTWGILCLSKSQDYKRTYSTNDNSLALREMLISAR